MNKMHQLENYQRQINQLDQQIRSLQADCQQIAMQQARLREQLSVAMYQMQTGDLPYSNHPPIDDDESAFLVSLIRATGHAMPVRDLVTIIREKHPDFIPLQIIGVNGFIQRKLAKACQQGHLASVDESHDLTRFYLLPEWRNEHGELLSGFQHQQMY